MSDIQYGSHDPGPDNRQGGGWSIRAARPRRRSLEEPFAIMSQRLHPEMPQKSRPLVRYLQEKIHTGQLAHGDRIPALRSFMEMFGMSYGTVKRGIDYLSATGLLEKRIGRGVYVATARVPVRSSARTLSICMCRNLVLMQRGIYPTVFAGIQEAAAQQQIALTLHHVDFESVRPADLEAIAERSDGMVFLVELDRYLDALDCPCPCVAVCTRSTFGGRLSTLDMDPWQAAELAAVHLLRRGIRTVTVITHSTPAYQHRARVFARQFAERGGSARIRDMADFSDFRADEGYLFTTGSAAEIHAGWYAERTGGDLFRDHVVVSLDGKHTLDPDYRPLPAVVAPWNLVGHLAFHDIQARLDRPGWPTRRTYVPGVLVDPESGDPDVC